MTRQPHGWWVLVPTELTVGTSEREIRGAPQRFAINGNDLTFGQLVDGVYPLHEAFLELFGF